MLRAAAILTRDQLLPSLDPYTGDQTPMLWNQVLHLLLPGGNKKFPIYFHTFPHHYILRAWEQDGRKRPIGIWKELVRSLRQGDETWGCEQVSHS